MSASALTSLVSCEKVQLRLNELYDNLPVEPTPLVAAMYSPENKNRIISQSVNPGGGKKRTVRVVYDNRYLESEVETEIDTSCSGGSPGTTYHDYTVDPDAGVIAKETIEMADLQDICMTNEEYFARRIMVMMDAARRQMEKQMSVQVALKVGNFATNDTEGVSGTVKTITTLTSGQFNEVPITEISYSAQKAGFRGKPIVIGSGLIQKWFMKVNAGCCNQYGINIADYAAQNPAVFLPSNYIEDALGSNEFLVLDFGAVFPLDYNRYDGKNGFNTVGPEGTGVSQGIIIDPITGVPFDYKYVYNACDELATIMVFKAVQLHTLPDDIFSGGDRLEGVNGVLNFKVTN